MIQLCLIAGEPVHGGPETTSMGGPATMWTLASAGRRAGRRGGVDCGYGLVVMGQCRDVEVSLAWLGPVMGRWNASHHREVAEAGESPTARSP